MSLPITACTWHHCLQVVGKGVAVSKPGQSLGWVHPATSLAQCWERRIIRKRKRRLGALDPKPLSFPGLLLWVSAEVSSCSTSFTSHGFWLFWAWMRRFGAKSG